MRRALVLSLLLTTIVAGDALASAKITIRNMDAAGVGFNDNTAATPVGGNNGTTLGQQRMNVFLKAAELWGAVLDSNVEILVDASFPPINTADAPCTANSGVLGSAGPTRIVANFKNAPLQNVWYPVALANKLAGEDTQPAVADIQARFNSLVGTANCLPTLPWYLGLDNNEGEKTDLLVVVLHEIGHGLGMTGSSSSTTGELRNGMPNIFELHAFDTATGLRWDQMSAQQRLASGVNTANLVWDGESTRNAAPAKLEQGVFLQATGALNRTFDLQNAAYGPRMSGSTLTGKVVIGLDPSNAAGTLTTDGCSAFTNADALRGNIVLVDRGTCAFVQKSQNAMAAGAKAIIVANNTSSDETCDPSPMGIGADVEDNVTIPSFGMRRRDADVLRAQLDAGVNGQLTATPNQLAGTSAQGFVRLYAPCTYDPGSSVHHWDTAASPNLLMEPFVNSDLTNSLDLTVNYLLDIGWGQGGPRTGRRSLRR